MGGHGKSSSLELSRIFSSEKPSSEFSRIVYSDDYLTTLGRWDFWLIYNFYVGIQNFRGWKHQYDCLMMVETQNIIKGWNIIFSINSEISIYVKNFISLCVQCWKLNYFRTLCGTKICSGLGSDTDI